MLEIEKILTGDKVMSFDINQLVMESLSDSIVGDDNDNNVDNINESENGNASEQENEKSIEVSPITVASLGSGLISLRK